LAHAPAAERERTERLYDLAQGPGLPALVRESAAQFLAVFHASQAFLSTRFGDAELVRIALASGNYHTGTGYVGNAYYQVLRDGPGDLNAHVAVACAAGELADALPAEDFAAIAAEVEAAWSGWPLEQQAYAAIILGREPRFAERVLDASDKYPQAMLSLVASLRRADQVVRLIKGLDQAWLYPQQWPPALLVLRRGVEAAPLLATMADRLKELRSIVEVMQAVQAPEIARVMGDLLDHRELKSLARSYLEKAPALAIATLATSRKQMAKSVVEALVRANASMVQELLPKLGAPERAAVEQILDRDEAIGGAGAASVRPSHLRLDQVHPPDGRARGPALLRRPQVPQPEGAEPPQLRLRRPRAASGADQLLDRRRRARNAPGRQHRIELRSRLRLPPQPRAPDREGELPGRLRA
ncbi:MAG: hypothetical protein K8H88_17050, partial [Sandaracinaceae bacterium]|nr:hypothetical protein [Sandaracinaceae bacterium]